MSSLTTADGQLVAIDDHGQPLCARCTFVIESTSMKRAAYPDERWQSGEGWMDYVHQSERECDRLLAQWLLSHRRGMHDSP